MAAGSPVKVALWTSMGLALCLGVAPGARGAGTPPHPAAGEEARPAVSPTSGYHRGFFVRTGDGSAALRLNGRVQGRFELDGAGRDVSHARFLLRRVRVTLKGHVFEPRLSYRLQVGLGEGRVALKDAWVQYALSERWARLRVGQFKRPFSREQLTSSGRQAFVDRAPTDKAFGAGRDLGIMLTSDPKAGGMELSVGVFNGTGAEGELSAAVRVDPATWVGRVQGAERSNVPDVFHPALVARVGYESPGLRGYSEGDLQGGGWRFGVAASGRVDFDAEATGNNLLAGEVDYVVKAYGFDTTGGLYAQRRVTTEGATQGATQGATHGDGGARTVSAETDVGGHVQAGYTVGGRVQTALRYAVVAVGDEGARRDASVAVSVFWRGHALKWQTDGTWFWGSLPTDAGWMVRSQVQLAF